MMVMFLNTVRHGILTFLCCTALLWGCGQGNSRNHKKMLVQDSTVYANQDYSPFRIDSNLVASVVLKDSTLDSFYTFIHEFYQRRNYQAAWFTDSSGFSTPAHTFIAQLRSYRDLYDGPDLTQGKLMFVGDTVELSPALMVHFSNPRPLMDVLLTAAYFRYANREYYGTSRSLHDLEWYIPRKKKNYLQLIEALVNADTSYSRYEPLSPFYRALQQALIQYRQIEKEGGLPIVSPNVKGMTHWTVGDTAPWVGNLKIYLNRTHDGVFNPINNLVTDDLIQALKLFQERMGLDTTGFTDAPTLQALKVPLAERILQIMVNMERLRWAPDTMPSNYLLVNIPDFTLHVMEQGRTAWKMKIIVGKDATGTSIFSSQLKTVVFRPYWNVPQSILVKEMLPILRRDPGYLARQHMEVLRGDTRVNPWSIRWSSFRTSVPYVVRQKPGNTNALGLILFQFPNQYDIYMHDTPAKGLFDADNRSMSHGCIRLAEAEKLAAYVLRTDTTVNTERIHRWMQEGEATRIPVRPSIPVYIVYLTAWPDGKGRLNFRPDIYHLDQKLGNEIFAR